MDHMQEELKAFKDPKLARGLIEPIQALAPQAATLMEVCGTHTVAIARNGIRGLMPEGVRLASGPGCPVCVTSNHDIDKVIALARVPAATGDRAEVEIRGKWYPVRVVQPSFVRHGKPLI